MSNEWLDFHTRPNTPKQRNEMIELQNSFLTERIKSRILVRKGRTREAVVLQVEAKSHRKIKEMGIV